MNKTELKKKNSLGGKKGMLSRWGKTFVCSIFPLDNNNRVTISYEGKSYTFAGKDRMKVLDEMFDFVRSIK